MRMPRIKARKGEDGLYHCMSRIVGGEYLLGMKEKERFVNKMWQVAEFLEIEVLDYVVMSNHYHQLVRVPGKVELSDEELLEKVRSYYGEKSSKTADLMWALSKGGEQAELIRRTHLKRMGNVSEFQKILKQGFSTWYNKNHKRCGTLWMERFNSVLVEDSLNARQIIATYIDLNPVRADMVEDPKNYRHCGYAAALGGDERCRRGIMDIMGIDDWQKAAAVYRVYLVERGQFRREGKSGAISRTLLLETLEKNGSLPRSELMYLRVRYLTDGLVLGSELFVEEVFERFRGHFGEKRKTGARPIRGLADDSLKVMRALRIDPIS
jgi:REP element-mobilizing transposase RayT